MQPRRLKVGFGFMPYGGNGNTSSEHPDIRNWLIPTIVQAKSDPRIDPDILYKDLADTPLTMVRNDIVGWAQENGVDVLVMVDSDNTPDIMLGLDPSAKPFFETSFDFLYNHYERGPVVIGAPYCGPPMQPDGSGTENVYVFLWRNFNSIQPTDRMALRQFEREEAAMRAGIEPVAALPTGCIMIDMRAFDLIPHPYFEYEYENEGPECQTCGCKKPGPRRQKASTEDVVTTRNISLNGCLKLGYNPVLCNWDAWAGHWKPRCVGKPVILTADRVGSALKHAVESGIRSDVKHMHIHRNPKLPKHPGDVNGPTVIHNGQPKAEPIPAFREAQNTNGADLEWLQQIVRSEAQERIFDDRPLTIVELGSWVGHSAMAMADAIEPISDYELHCVDHWKGGNAIQRKVAEQHDAFEEFQRNVGDKLGKSVFVHRGDTVAEAAQWTGRPIDVLFIDAGHTYDECLADILAWTPHVRKGGVICGHDYNSLFYGVKQAVHEVFGWQDVAVQVGTCVWAVRNSDTVSESVQKLKRPAPRIDSKRFDARAKRKKRSALNGHAKKI